MMFSRLLLVLRHPWKFASFSWMLLRSLTVAFVDRLLFPFACRAISFRTEIVRCYLGASLACFLELVFTAPPNLGPDDFQTVKLNGVSAVVVPPEARLDSVGHAASMRTVLLLYAHGGGYLFGEPLMYIDAYKRWVSEAAANGIRLIVVSVDYRLSTAAKFPAYRDDFIESYRSLIVDKGISPDAIVFGGDSAGGNLCAISAIHARNIDLPQPAGLILLSPWLDLTHDHTLYSPAMKTDFLVTFSEANPMLVKSLLPAEMTASDPQVSPLFDNLDSLPPQIVFVGTAEVLLPDSIEWANRSKDAGNSIDLVLERGQVHMYPLGRPFCSKSVEVKTDLQLIKFIRDVTSRLNTKGE